MVTIRDSVKVLSGILVAIAALCLGWVFWLYFQLSFGTPFGIFVTLVMLGYIYIVVGIARLKTWALGMFFTIFLLAVLIEIILLMIGDPKKNILESISHLTFWIALVAIPVFGISALIRFVRRKLLSK